MMKLLLNKILACALVLSLGTPVALSAYRRVTDYTDFDEQATEVKEEQGWGNAIIGLVFNRYTGTILLGYGAYVLYKVKTWQLFPGGLHVK